MELQSAWEHDPVSHAVIGAAFEVANILGHGFLEAVYRRALAHEIGLRCLHVGEEVQFRVHYKDLDVGTYIADLIVDGQLIVEVKALDKLSLAHHGQLLSYLKASGLRRGLLINFGSPRVEVKRVSL